nr:hypothetical protein [Deltaproteobacteria bacterium]
MHHDASPRRDRALPHRLGLLRRLGAALDYDATLAAAAPERDGHPAAAAATLAPLAAAFPEDHAVALRLAWLTFSSADYPSARRHYARALALSAGASVDARLDSPGPPPPR